MQKESGSPGAAAACASCRHQRKKCTENCILAPYFPLNKSKEFQAVHKLFGVSNVTKILSGLDFSDRKRAVDSLVWEATCRQNDPVLGSFGEFSRVYEELEWFRSQFRTNFQIPAGNNMTFLDINNTGFNSTTSSSKPGFMCMNGSTSAALLPANSYPAGYNTYECTDRLRDEYCSSVRNTTDRFKEDSNNSSVILPQQYGVVQHIDNFKEESNNGSVILPQHYAMTTGYDQPCYQLSGQYGPSTDAKP